MKEKVNKLRTQIDQGIAKKINVSDLKEQLALYYILNPNEGGLTFDSEDLTLYLEDWFVRDIRTAEEFIPKAILVDEGVKLGTTLALHKEFNSPEKLAILEGLQTNKKELYKKAEEIYLSQHEKSSQYLGLADKQITFDIKNINEYIQDWLAGIKEAESFVVEAIKQDLSILYKMQDTYSIENANKVVNLILKQPISALTLKTKFLCTEEARDRSKILKEIYLSGLIDEVLGDATFNDFLVKLFKKDKIGKCRSPLPFIEDPTIITAYCTRFGKDDFPEAIYGVYIGALVSARLRVNPDTCIQALFEIKNSIDQKADLLKVSELKIQPEKNSSKKIEKLDHDIHLEFYLASVKKDIEALLDLAFTKNPTLFSNLLKEELHYLFVLAVRDVQEFFLKNRESFYRELFSHQDMRVFYDYKECLEKVNNAFDRVDLAPINPPLQLKITLLEKEELKQTDFFSIEEKQEEKTHPASSIATTKEASPTVTQSFLSNIQDSSFFSYFIGKKEHESPSTPVKKADEEEGSDKALNVNF